MMSELCVAQMLSWQSVVNVCFWRFFQNRRNHDLKIKQDSFCGFSKRLVYSGIGQCSQLVSLVMLYRDVPNGLYFNARTRVCLCN